MPTSGLNTTARTAAKVIGNTISLTAASAVNTMIAANTNPTKLHDHTPNRGIRPNSPGAAPAALPARPSGSLARHTTIIGAGSGDVVTQKA